MDGGTVLVIVLVILVVAGFIASFISIFYHLFKYFWGEVNTAFFPISDPKKTKDYLEEYFRFYQKLPPKSKYNFRKRVAYFIFSKDFIPRNISEVTTEMKVLISAAAIQLTFGYPRVNLSYFRNILVYPDAYYSTINRAHHKGEVNPKLRAIVLSWKDFVEGYMKNDGRNLGLHEMAHALRLENRIMNEEYNFLDPHLLEEWELRATHTMKEIEEGREDFFREYGSVDNEEFFAVAVENFFERPVLFAQKHPLTYTTLSELLRQDPILLEQRGAALS